MFCVIELVGIRIRNTEKSRVIWWELVSRRREEFKSDVVWACSRRSFKLMEDTLSGCLLVMVLRNERAVFRCEERH